MKKAIFLLITGTFLFATCKHGNKQTSSQNNIDSSNVALKTFELTEVWRTDSVLKTPESVIYDKKRDVFYISDVNLEPMKKDGNGFITRMDKDGKILDLTWISGLSSPKGMAIIEDTLFASDVDEIVVMDIKSGKILRKIHVPGSTMLNDITSDSEGSLYISDSNSNKIHKYTKGAITEWLSEGLNGPNGLLAENGRLLVASGEFAELDLQTKTRKVLTENLNAGDGIAYLGTPGYYLVSDWNGEVFMINPDYSKVSLLNTRDQKINSADITYVPEMQLLLVPTFFKNSVVAYDLKEK